MFFRKLRICLFFLAAGIIWAPMQTEAATVTRKKKKGITIDEGKSSGVTKGTRVCFYNNKGKKVGCGKVNKAWKKKAIVRARAKTMKRVKKGFEARINGGTGDSVASSGGGDIDGIALRASWMPSILSPVTYNNVNFVPPTGTPETLWDATVAADSMVLVGFGGDLELRSLGLDFGVKYKSYSAYLVSTSYGTTTNYAKDFVDHKIEGSSLGVFFDYLMYSDMGGGSLLAYGVGLDVDMSTVTLSAIHKKDDDTTYEDSLFTVTSTGSIISLRIPVRYDLALSTGLGMSFGGTLMVPVSGTPTASVTTNNDDEQVKTLTSKNADEDIVTALGHTKSGFGFELVSGLYLVF